MYASIFALGVLLTYRLASLFQTLLSPRSVSPARMYASINVFGVSSAYRVASLFQTPYSLSSIYARKIPII
jgi:hypothetical protein